MSVIEKALAKEGMAMVADTLPKGQRGVKSFQRLIAAMRACEAEVLDRLSKAEEEQNKALRQNLELHERLRRLEAENLQHRLKNKLGEIDSLTVGDRTRLLEVSHA